MPDKWMSVAEAATVLKVHPRTIERRIAGGKIQSRRAEDGVLQVMINLPDAPDTVQDGGAALETVRELAADQVTLATGSASAIVRFAQNDALRAREELVLWRQDAGRARRSAVAAWCVVAILGVGACVAVGWTASKITKANSDMARAQDDVRQLNERADAMKKESDKLKTEFATERQQMSDEIARVRQEAEQARLAGAEASGKLAAYIEQSHKRPTTQPRTLAQRIASALAEPE
jgi:hypothetical protein